MKSIKQKQFVAKNCLFSKLAYSFTFIKITYNHLLILSFNEQIPIIIEMNEFNNYI